MQKIIAVLGPTASGKTAMAINLALKFNGEIICLDSRTIYKDMNIGTAKPTLEDMRSVPHHLLDIANPDQTATLSDIKKIAGDKIEDIIKRGKLPFLVGGTALYAYAIIDNWQIPEVKPDVEYRKELDNKNLDQLVVILKESSPEKYLAVDLKNKRRVIRALEIVKNGDIKPTKQPRKYDVLKIGISRDEKYLRANIEKRTKKMIAEGLVDEVKNLLATGYDKSLPALSGIHYKEMIDFIEGKTSLEEAIKLIDTHDWQLTRRQMTWLKRDKEINWIDSLEDTTNLCIDFLK